MLQRPSREQLVTCMCPTPRAGEQDPRQNGWVGRGSSPFLCLGVSLATSPLQTDGSRSPAGAFSQEEMFLLEGLARPPRADACCYDNRRRLLCAEQNRGGWEGRGIVVEKVLEPDRGIGLVCLVQGWRTPPGMKPSRGIRRS